MVNKKHVVLKKKDLLKRLQFFSTLKKLPKKQIQSLAPYLSTKCTHYLCEALYNIIHVDLGLSAAKKRKLKKELQKCNKIKYLCDKKICPIKRKNILKQKGGFLGTLLSVAIPSIISLISALTQKNKNE